MSSICTMIFAFSSWLPAALVFLAMMSMFQAYFRTTQGIVVLTMVPDRFRARTMSVLAYERAFLTGISVLVEYWPTPLPHLSPYSPWAAWGWQRPFFASPYSGECARCHRTRSGHE